MANGLLGKQLSQAGQFVTVYTVPATGVQFATVNINILNKAGTIANVDVAITDQNTPSDVDFIAFQDELAATGGSVGHTYLPLSPGEKVMVRSNNALTVTRVHGLEKPV